jgi:hypothetical protein
MNQIGANDCKGTFGELLVQLRLLQHGVQAAPPIKDSGNDLIAIKGEQFRAVQVKLRKSDKIRITKLPEQFHILAIVAIDPPVSIPNVRLDDCKVFLLPADESYEKVYKLEELKEWEISQGLVNSLFKG